MDIIYDSRDISFKAPYGAVKTGERVRFLIKPPRRLGVCSATLDARDDMGREYHIPMEWQSLCGACDVYKAEFTAPSEPCIVTYSFRLEHPGKDMRLTRSDCGHACVTHGGGPEWQLTVYRSRMEYAADWYGEGVTYQIFPDRFRRTELPAGKKWASERVVHERWDDRPEYMPDERGEIRNNDFFGGSFAGITEALPYLASLGVKTVYLNPIFESASNHRYDTADYEKTDALLGSEDDFRTLCYDAEKLGMRVLLDGVFNHTGSDSVYFNREGLRGEGGAFRDKNSPYYSWYDFSVWPYEYSSWWGIKTLPQTNDNDPGWREFITGDDGIVRKWLALGASGWRLDVADELSDDFISEISESARKEKPDAVVIGEVWEDATTKISYGARRRYLINGSLDAVMNYPFKNALLAFLTGGDASCFMREMEDQRENYPPHAWRSLMNHIGTHDTARALTVLGLCGCQPPADRTAQSEFRLSAENLTRGRRLLKLASLIQFCFPGSPTVYYGDEAGMQGLGDPFNRGTYPWGNEDAELTRWYRTLGRLRTSLSPLMRGDISYDAATGGVLAFTRSFNGEYVTAAVNRSDENANISLSCGCELRDALSGQTFTSQNGMVNVLIPPLSGMILL